MEFEQIEKSLLIQSIEKGGTLKRILERIDAELPKYSWNIKKLRKFIRDTPNIDKSKVNHLVPRLSESECYNAAKLHTSAKDFRTKSPYEYDWASKNGWLPQYTWLIKNYKTEKDSKWTKEACVEESKKYKYFSDYREHSTFSYRMARKNGWLEEFTWLETKLPTIQRDLNLQEWSVYVYEISENHSAYIGLTVDCHRRHYEHLSKEKDTLYKYCLENNIELPKYILIKNSLTAVQAQDLEDFTKHEYANNGWNIINKAKTGVGSSSLGGNCHLLWTKDKCKVAASKCTYRSEFKLNYPRAYTVSCKNKWIEEFGLLLKPKYIPEGTSKKTVLMLNLNGEFEMEFDSIYAAGEFINPDNIQNGRKSVSLCCNGKRNMAYGHKWRFKE